MREYKIAWPILVVLGLLLLVSFYLLWRCWWPEQGNKPVPQQTQQVAKKPGTKPEVVTVDTKPFEAAVSLAQTISGWALLLIAGSVVIIVGADYVHPLSKWGRAVYFLFVPGWYFLGMALYKGTHVQGTYLAAVFRSKLTATDVEGLKNTANLDAYAQIQNMQFGAISFVLWLIFFLFWWVFFKNENKISNG